MLFYGFFTSLQYTSMNTLVYADVTTAQESSTPVPSLAPRNKCAVSFGVAAASLVTVFFLPAKYLSDPNQFIHGLHRAFFVLGGMTLFSTLVFSELKKGDGDAVSRRAGHSIGGKVADVRVSA